MAKHMKHLADSKKDANKLFTLDSFIKTKEKKSRRYSDESEFRNKSSNSSSLQEINTEIPEKLNKPIIENLSESYDFQTDLPTVSQLEAELEHENTKMRKFVSTRNIVFMLITVSAIAVLVATLLMPVLQIYGSSMTPTLTEGNIVVTVKGNDFKQGDVISFYYNNKILVKRVIAFQGDWVNIDEEGNIFINGQLLDEPYLTEKAFGECDIELPYQVPDGKVFVCGDHRATSVDSRSSTIGCVSEEQVVGKIIFCVWPFNNFGTI